MTWLAAAYAVFFIAIFAYTLLMARRQRDLDRRVEELRERVQQMQEKGLGL